VRASDPMSLPDAAGLLPHGVRRSLQQVMDADAGVLRSAESLQHASGRLMEIGDASGAAPSTEDWETTNLHQIATVLLRQALVREETRGSHWREDFPERDDRQWRVRLVTRVGDDGDLATRKEPVVGVTS